MSLILKFIVKKKKKHTYNTFPYVQKILIANKIYDVIMTVI